ncbi:uncharacterized protein LOC120351397 [Nilaparvata lugens]|uniref:uncharacterized protein LOC120351397 n=1 Tax=Nilaparvata lugens TaxID=108931 RepID=UPI00193E42F4|nr:uncharacterized protein LOC120351397 [Nilaparvata lugens]
MAIVLTNRKKKQKKTCALHIITSVREISNFKFQARMVLQSLKGEIVMVMSPPALRSKKIRLYHHLPSSVIIPNNREGRPAGLPPLRLARRLLTPALLPWRRKTKLPKLSKHFYAATIFTIVSLQESRIGSATTYVRRSALRWRPGFRILSRQSTICRRRMQH